MGFLNLEQSLARVFVRLTPTLTVSPISDDTAFRNRSATVSSGHPRTSPQPLRSAKASSMEYSSTSGVNLRRIENMRCEYRL